MVFSDGSPQNWRFQKIPADCSLKAHNAHSYMKWIFESLSYSKDTV